VSAPWLPRGIGRIGFVALVLAGGLLVVRGLAGQPPVDPVIGKVFPLAASIPFRRAAPSRRAGAHMINMFASWCVPCRAEASALAALTARGARIDGIAVRDEPAAVTQFLARTGNPFASVWLDPDGKIQRTLGVSGVPETYVVDAGGVIVYRHRGALEAADVTTLASYLQ